MAYFRMGEITRSQSRQSPFTPRGIISWAGVLAAACLLTMSSHFLSAGSADGDLRGVVQTMQGVPLAGARVLVHNLENNTERTLVTDGQGAFGVDNLPPGHYQLSASKEGWASPAVSSVSLAARQNLRVSMVFTSAVGVADTAPAPSGAILTAKAAAGIADDTPLTPREELLLERLEKLEKRLETLEAREATSSSLPASLPAPAVGVGKTGGGALAIGAVAAAAPPSAAGASTTASGVHAAPSMTAAPGTGSVAPTPQPVLVASLSGITPIASTEKPVVVPITTIAAPSLPATPPLPSLQIPGGTGNKANAVAAEEPAPEKKKKIDPFSDWDWTWLNGNPRTKDIYWDSKFFTPEIRTDVTANWDNQHPADHTVGGSSEIFRTGEVQLEQLGVGGDFHWDNVRARLMTQFGAYSTATIRNDGSYTHGEWDIANADRYVSEAYGGYHFNWLYGVNVDAGIFMSYIGLFSYYNFDNWAYQPSYVSSNTPWFFQGVRIQIFPTPHLKIEPWFVNGWQSYDSANNRPGLGGQLKWTPYSWINIISNNYGQGRDDLYTPGRARIHSDNSIEVKYFDHPKARYLDKMAFTLTGDIGCEYGGGVSCTGDHAGGPKQSFLGGMAYNRWWFDRDQFAVTVGGGAINNPGRYLVLLPPINGMTAGSAAINSPYFTENPGDPFKAWDGSFTLDWMPKQYITFRIEPDYRHANVPYWTGHGGITPPAYAGTPSTVINGNGYPAEFACNSGAPSGQTTLALAQSACSGMGGVWYPNLVRSEFLVDFDILVKF